MLPKRVIVEFDNAVLDGKSYIKHMVIVDDPLSISVIMDVLNRSTQLDKNGDIVNTDLPDKLAKSLSDRYTIPEEYDYIDYLFYERKRVM